MNVINAEPFFERTLRWMRHDVRVCMENGAFVGAMTLMLTHVAALSGFYAGRQKEKPDNDQDEFIKFFNNYFRKFSNDPARDAMRILEDSKEKELIYTHFRCGLIHEHLMKSGTAIDRGEIPYIFVSQAGVTLNVDIFYQDYLETLNEYYSDVGKNKTLRANFEKRAEYLGAYKPYL